jgi:hypothetical protein
MLIGAISGQEPTAQPPPPPTKFIAVGTDFNYTDSNIQISTDGVSWNRISTPNLTGIGSVLNSICTNGSRWLAVGRDSLASDHGLVLTSDDDGYHWTSRSNPFSALSAQMNAVCWDGTNFIAVGELGNATTPRVMTSPDGTTWTSRTSAPTTGVHWHGVAAYSGGVVAVGRLNPGAGAVMTSTDHGATWTQRTAAATATYLGVTNNDQVTANTWCAVGAPSSSTTRIMTSTNNGTSWTARTGATANVGLWAVAWLGTFFIAVGGDENASPVTPQIMTSPTGTTWTARTPAGVGVNSQIFRGVAIAADASVVIAAGHNGGYALPVIQSSANGTTGWTALTSDPTFANVGPFFAIAAAIEVST